MKHPTREGTAISQAQEEEEEEEEEEEKEEEEEQQQPVETTKIERIDNSANPGDNSSKIETSKEAIMDQL